MAETITRDGTGKRAGLWIGLLGAVLVIALPEGLGPEGEARRVAAVGVLMAAWWASEAVPVAATALVPMIAFPLLGVDSMAGAAAPYADPLIFLFLGGFVIALAIERCNLHRRIALALVGRFRGRPRATVGGFMLASALLSMWISNTATALMMLPIARSAAPAEHREGAAADDAEAPDGAAQRRFRAALMLGVAYGCSIGGLGTLIGTPPNALLAAFLSREHGVTVGFAQWMLVGVPVVAAMLPLAWLVLVRVAFPLPATLPPGNLEPAAGRPDAAQRRTAAVALAVAALWIARPWLAALPGLEGLSDTGIALAGAVVLFVIPAGDASGRRLMDWPTAKRLPWEVLLLFGGGLSLAEAVNGSGLAGWIGAQMGGMAEWPLLAAVAATALLILFLTELTSNTATAATFLPVAAAVAAGMGSDPVVMAVAVALAASCAFMLPVATPPNAIVYGSGQVPIGDMVRAGLWLNLIGVVVITLAAAVLAPWALAIIL